MSVATARPGAGRRNVWGRLAGPAAAGAAACAGFAVAPLTPVPEYVTSGSAGLAGLSLVAGVAAYRSARRDELISSVQVGLTALIGSVSQTRVKPARWRGGFVGVPHRLTVWFDSQARTHDPKWSPQLLEICKARTGLTYTVKAIDHRRSRLLLVAAAAASGVASTPEQRRAERTIGELLGPTAKVTAMEMAAGQLVKICAAHQNGTRLANSGYRARVERTLSAVLPGRWRAKWDLQGDTVVFEHRPSFPKIIWLEPSRLDQHVDVLATYDEVAIAYGADEDGNPAIWRPAIDPNLMVVGSPGTGKTVLEHAILVQVSRYNWPIWVLDGKSVEFLGFRRDWPNVQVVATAIEQQVALVERAHQVMEHRYQLITQGLAREEDFEPLMVFVDEYADFRANLMDWYVGVKQKGDPAKPPCLSKVSSIARKGRTSRVHLLFATQRPDAEFIGGEALALTTPIPTPAGWSTMGDLHVGDTVFGEAGRPVAVSAVTDVLVGRPCYRVRFSDGSSIVADANHLWSAVSSSSRVSARAVARRPPLSRSQRWPDHDRLRSRVEQVAAAGPARVTVAGFEAQVGSGRIPLLRRGLHDGRRAPAEQIVTTLDLADTVRTPAGESNWSVKACGALQLPEADLPIDPWLLGYWLGDGHKAAATIATADQDVLERIRSLGYVVTHYARFNYGIATGPRGGSARHRPSLKASLRQTGLLHNKHIPPAYLRASVRQREELLAGLLDSDGTCTVRGGAKVLSGQVSFNNSDRGLIDGFVELATSLGFIPTVRQVREAGLETSPNSVAFGCQLRPAWTVSFTPDRQVFGLRRKQVVLEPALAFTRSPTTRQRYVVAVEPVASVPVRCITVDSDTHLYLAGRQFVPTHNCRDNFRARVSMGRLSPQGAMMMWQDPSTGTTVPRACRGRATTINDDNVPVEIQTFYIPDPRRAKDPESQERLALVRPAESIHQRLVILAPEVAEPEEELGYQHYVDAQWVTAASRPDLDPANLSQTSADDAREMASPLTVLGVDGRRSAIQPPALGRSVGGGMPAAEPVDEPDPFIGFGPVIDASPDEVMIGDLVLHPDLDEWVTVDAPVEEDVTEPSNRSIFWRDDTDEAGHLSVPADEVLSVRRPVDDEDDAA